MNNESISLADPSKRLRVAILGAGPAGLAAAKYLSVESGYEITVIESSERAGGLMASHEFDGDHFDVGTILFSESHGLLDAFPFLRPNLVEIKYAPRSINPSKKIDVYPFSLSGYAKSYGHIEILKSALQILVAKIKYRKRATVSEYAMYYMGENIYKKSGLQNYIYRLHELSDNQLDVEFAERRLAMIKRQSLREMTKRFFGIGKNKKKIGGAMMVRPIAGFQEMFAQIVADIDLPNVKLLRNTDITSIQKNDSGFTLTTDVQEFEFDEILSTIPISRCLEYFGKTSKNAQRTKGLISLYFRGRIKPNGNTFFNFSYEGRWKRITVFSRFYGESTHVDGPDWFTVEVTSDSYSEDSVRQLVEEFSRLATEFKIVENPPNYVSHSYTDEAYPIYSTDTVEQVKKDKEILASYGVHLLGRQGNFEYVISNIVARRAKKLATKIITTRS